MVIEKIKQLMLDSGIFIGQAKNPYRSGSHNIPKLLQLYQPLIFFTLALLISIFAVTVIRGR